MQRLKSAFRFIDHNFQMAQSHEAIQKPWMYLTLGILLLTLLWLVPIAGLLIGVGSRPLVWVLIGLVVLLYLLSLLIWGEVTALKTAQIFANVIQGDEVRTHDELSGNVYKTHWIDVLVYVLSLPGLRLLLGIQQLVSGKSRSDQAWLTVHPLIPPIIAMENLDLQEAARRANNIVVNNYLRFQPGYLPVGAVARGVEWVSILVGVAVGVFLTTRIADPFTAGSWRAFLGVSAGLVVLGIFSTAGIAFSTYFRTCYHTALYIWALEAQEAHKQSSDVLVSPPEILSQAMWKKPKYEKEGSDATKT